SELTATDYSHRGEFEVLNHHRIVVGVTRSSPGPSDIAAQVAAGPPAVHGGRGRTVHGGRGRNLVGRCDHGPFGRERGACDLGRQRGASAPALLHSATLP